jgi:hypothetical protein
MIVLITFSSALEKHGGLFAGLFRTGFTGFASTAVFVNAIGTVSLHSYAQSDLLAFDVLFAPTA